MSDDITLGELLGGEDIDHCPVCGAEVVEYSFDRHGRNGLLEPCGHPIPRAATDAG